jgi:hypothetical protein
MTTTWRGQDIELQRRFIRAVADKFAVRIEQLSVSVGGDGLSRPGTDTTLASREPNPREGSSF